MEICRWTAAPAEKTPCLPLRLPDVDAFVTGGGAG